MNKLKIIGIGVLILGGVLAYFFEENKLISFLSGVFCAIGLLLILNFLPIKKRNTSNH